MKEVFDKYINSYLASLNNASLYTVRNYHNDLKAFANFLVNKNITSLEKISEQMLINYMSELNTKNISKTSVYRKLSIIRCFFKYLFSEKFVASNPMNNVIIPIADIKPRDFLNEDEIESLLKQPNIITPRGQRDLAILKLLYYTGLRVGELVSLNVSQIKLDNQEIIILGRGSRNRNVPISSALNALELYLNDGRFTLLKGKQNDALFIVQGGKRIAIRRVQKILNSYTKKAGLIRKISPNLLRNTYAVQLFKSGVKLNTVKKLLGYKHVFTAKVYAHGSRS